VTAEVTPHHLLLTDDLAQSYDPIFKVNPPLRTEADVVALREGLAEGIIDIVATDHAPHPLEAKECEWQEAAFGMLGLETALSIVQKTMIDTGLMNWDQLSERMSFTPAKIGRYEDQGQPVSVGSPANLAVVNPNQYWTVDRDLVVSKSSNTPYHGYELPGVVTHTFYKGKHTLINGKNSQIGAK
jgi:dihydroorotase